MTLLHEARNIKQELSPKLDQITTLTTQARKLLLDHGQPILKKEDIGDKLVMWTLSLVDRKKVFLSQEISRQIDGIEVQIFSIGGRLTLVDEAIPIIVSIPVSGKSLALQGEKSIAQDEINNPGSPNSLSRISLDDLNAWRVVIQSVEDSFRFNQ